MPYPEGLIILGLPVILLAVGVEFLIRKGIRSRNGEASFQQERTVKFLTRAATLAILTVIYFLMKDGN